MPGNKALTGIIIGQVAVVSGIIACLSQACTALHLNAALVRVLWRRLYT